MSGGTIVSTGGASKTIIDGGGNGPAVLSALDDAFACAIGECWQVTATIRGFTITGGSGYRMPSYLMDEYVGPYVAGGGVLNAPGSNLTLVNDIVTGNDVTLTLDEFGDPYFGMGGGIFNDAFAKLTPVRDDGEQQHGVGRRRHRRGLGRVPDALLLRRDVHVQKSTVTGNHASEYGGGLMLTTHGSMTVSSSSLSHNVAGPATGDCYNSGQEGGGAILNLGGHLTINGGTVANHAATSGPGGGLLNIYEASASIGNADIKSNVAEVGGGIANCQQATLNLHEGKIQSNTASLSGGGLDAEDGSPWSAVNTAIQKNRPDQQNTTTCGITIELPPG